MARISDVSTQDKTPFRDYSQIPECLQALNESMLANDNLAIAEFLCVALPAFLDAVNDLPFSKEGVEPVVRGMELVLSLLAERLAMAAGKSFIPMRDELGRAGAD